MSDQKIYSTDPSYGLPKQAAPYEPGAGAPSNADMLANRVPTSSTEGDEEPGVLDRLNAMLAPLAHPQTLTDFANLLLLPVDEARKAHDAAVAVAAGRGPVGHAISATGRGLQATGDTLNKPLTVGGAVETMRNPVKGAAALVAPSALRIIGRMLQTFGDRVAGTADVAPALLSASEEADLAKQGYSPEVIAKIKSGLAMKAARAVDPAVAAAPAAPAAPAPLAGSPVAPAPPVAATPAPAPVQAAAPAMAAPVQAGDTLGLPAAQRTAGQMSEAWLGNDIAVAARRARIAMAPKEIEQAIAAVKASGMSPAEAVQAFALHAARDLSAGLSTEEKIVFGGLVEKGSTPAEALKAVQAMKKLGGGLPSGASVEAAVKARNLTGRWQ